MKNFRAEAEHLFEYTRSIRRDLHNHPELAFKEFRTAGIVARELSQLGLEVTTGIAETGVVALLESEKPGPVLLVRFDMDALPILEDTGVDYSSQNPGVMHACGHDSHVAVGLSVARLLVEARDQIQGSVKFVFQPAEEGMGGAERMLEAGIMHHPDVDYTLSMHVWNEKPVGWVGISPGPIMAGADIFDVNIEGRGGHGALPQETVDPVVAAAQIISALQTIVSRNISPLDTAVISVCRVRAGEAFNVIPQSVNFSGTFRTFDAKVREKLIQRFETLVMKMAEAMGCKAVVSVKKMTPAVINDPIISPMLHKRIQEIYPDMIIDDSYRCMVSEDMAYMMEKAPGCYILIGSGYPETILNYGHHHPKFNINEDVLVHASAIISTAVLELLKKMYA
jgi:amidohydrolase